MDCGDCGFDGVDVGDITAHGITMGLDVYAHAGDFAGFDVAAFDFTDSVDVNGPEIMPGENRHGLRAPKAFTNSNGNQLAVHVTGHAPANVARMVKGIATMLNLSWVMPVLAGHKASETTPVTKDGILELPTCVASGRGSLTPTLEEGEVEGKTETWKQFWRLASDSNTYNVETYIEVCGITWTVDGEISESWVLFRVVPMSYHERLVGGAALRRTPLEQHREVARKLWTHTLSMLSSMAPETDVSARHQRTETVEAAASGERSESAGAGADIMSALTGAAAPAQPVAAQPSDPVMVMVTLPRRRVA